MNFIKKNAIKLCLVLGFVCFQIPFAGAWTTCTTNSDKLCLPSGKGNTFCGGSGGGVVTCDGSGGEAGSKDTLQP